VSPSRYATVGTATWVTADGRRVPYLLRRLLPAPGSMAVSSVHVVRAGERIDTIAAATLGDPELSWRLGDANAAMRPTELAQPPGRTLQIPGGVTGAQ
jgi:hypothetical protein